MFMPMASDSRSLKLPKAPFRFAVVNLGCKVNRIESDTIAAALIACGGRPSQERDSSIIVVNTCTVTGEADKKARKAVRQALKASEEAAVYVTGCGVAIDANAYEQIDRRVHAVGKAELLASLSEAGDGALRMGGDFRTRLNIKVQDGCDRACTYCIVHVARGPARSVPFEAVLAEAREYLARGVKEIVLAGIDLGSYRDGGRRLEHLVSALVEEADRASAAGEIPARIRASSLEPVSVDEGFVELLASLDGRLCRHLHLPLQSGCSRVLREMARPYGADDFAHLVEGLYDRVPSLSLSTDIIVGFPGETDRDFEQTMQMARRCRFSKIHVFPYSPRAGTPAAARSDQVAPEVKLERAARLRALSDELRSADWSRRIGSTELCIVEPSCAITESYHEIAAPPHAEIGSLLPITLS